MGRIFGISDLPVSTPMTPFEPVFVPQPVQKTVRKPYVAPMIDVVDLTTKPAKKNKSFIAMRNGIGKLMSSYSKKLIK